MEALDKKPNGSGAGSSSRLGYALKPMGIAFIRLVK
jgi:hypothetical protein